MESPGTERLILALADARDRSQTERVTIQNLVEALGPSSLLLVCLFLTIPFLQPFSLGPFSMIGGLTFAAIGGQILRQRPELKLPEAVFSMAPPARSWFHLHRVTRGLLGWVQKYSRVRKTSWVQGLEADRRIGFIILLGGLLMAVPFWGMPLNNTFPAVVIFFAVLAKLQRDGIMLIYAWIAVVLTLLYFALIIVLYIWMGETILKTIKDCLGF